MRRKLMRQVLQTDFYAVINPLDVVVSAEGNYPYISNV